MTIAILSSIRTGMGLHFIQAISTLAESLVSIRRIQVIFTFMSITNIKATAFIYYYCHGI